MRIRILYLVCGLCSYLRMYKNLFTKKGYENLLIIVHGIMYLEGKTNCLKIAESYHKKISHQRLIEYINNGKIKFREIVEKRVTNLVEKSIKYKANTEDILKDYLLFSIDPTDFRKSKGKKTQGVRYSSDGKSKYLAHTIVMSAFIYGLTTIPFKLMLYWGKTKKAKKAKKIEKIEKTEKTEKTEKISKVNKNKRKTKAQIFISLGQRASNYFRQMKGKLASLGKIAVFDGEGANKTVLSYFHKSIDWLGFVTKFPRTRCILFGNVKIHIRSYLQNLSQNDFQSGIFNGKTIYFHSFIASIPSLAFLGQCHFLVIQTQPFNLSQKSFRIIFSNISSLSTLQLLTIYSRRWLQETYHQILKDSFGLKSYKHRLLVAIFRLIEFGNLAFSFLELQRFKSPIFISSLSSIRRSLLLKQSAYISKKLHLVAT